MKNKSRKPVHMLLPVVPYVCNYIGWIAWLESILKRKPRKLRLDIMGAGEIPADAALSIRCALMKRSGKTRLITNARSTLQGGSVLIWLLGDRRKIRDDAKIFFRRADESEIKEVRPDEKWTGEDSSFMDSYSQADPYEGDHARVLELILPVRDELRQFCRCGSSARRPGGHENASGSAEAALDESKAA